MMVYKSININKTNNLLLLQIYMGPSLPRSYSCWIYNYLCYQCLLPLILWVWISIRAMCTTLCDKVCQWLITGQWFSPGSSTIKTDCYDITEILLKVVLNTIKQTNKYRKYLKKKKEVRT